MKWLFRKSKWIHKYLGLFLILYSVLMGFTGIFVNHPGLIDGFSVPRWLAPSQYDVQNWNRGSLAQVYFSKKDPLVAYFSGSEGVWKTIDGGASFHAMNSGYAHSPYLRQTYSILLLERETGDILFAGSEGGLFVCDPHEEHWKQVNLQEGNEQAVRSVLLVGDKVLAFTDSDVFQADATAGEPVFRQVQVSRDVPDDVLKYQKLPLVLFFFDLHSGAIFGLPGKLIVDITGVIIIFLSFSAFYLWYYPRKRRNARKKSRRPGKSKLAHSIFRKLFNYHLKIGIWVAVILFTLSGTGLFMRPPLIILLSLGSVPAWMHPGTPSADSWKGRIRRAVYDSYNHRIIIEGLDGFWAAPEDLSEPFHTINFNVPIHVMGSNVLLAAEDNRIIAGSFSGVFSLDCKSGLVTDLTTGKPPHNVSLMRLSKHMISGYFRSPEGVEYIADFHKGLQLLPEAIPSEAYPMPEELSQNARLPLWNYMFELHNSRFFRDWVGEWYRLIPPLGSLLFLLLTVTGIYDWIYLKAVPHRHE